MLHLKLQYLLDTAWFNRLQLTGNKIPDKLLISPIILCESLWHLIPFGSTSQHICGVTIWGSGKLTLQFCKTTSTFHGYLRQPQLHGEVSDYHLLLFVHTSHAARLDFLERRVAHSD